MKDNNTHLASSLNSGIVYRRFTSCSMSFIYVTFLLLLFSCRSPQKLSVYNMSAMYNFSNFTELPAVLYNQNDSISKLFVRVNTEDLSYESEDEMKALKAVYTLHYDLFYSFTENRIIDSNTLTVVDSTNITGNIISHTFDVKAYSGSDYILRLKLLDRNTGNMLIKYLYLLKTKPNVRNDFLLTDQNGFFKEETYVSSGNVYFLKNNTDPEEFMIRYYDREFPVALPPFVDAEGELFDYNADSIYSVHVSDSIAQLEFPEYGFYHVQPDSSSRNGFSLFNFYQGFPELVNSEQLLQPLRYITSQSEFKQMEQLGDDKLAVDQFWLENAGNPVRARNMIKRFYNRVVDANVFFSSYHEGWKTDRGLIYIVFGPPQLVYFSDEKEEWVYGEKGHSNSIEFQFYKVENPFTDNDYSLLKSSGFKEKWYEAVNMWRR